jgi:hypothetical protein
MDFNGIADSSSDEKDHSGSTPKKEPSSSSSTNATVVEDTAALAEKLASILNETMLGMKDKDANFTWEHFFTEHCKILKDDALFYERNLIMHRLDPLDTLLEAMDLLVEFGKIPIGDKIKIQKCIERQLAALAALEKKKAEAKKSFGLEKYSDFDAGVILKNAGGIEDDYIDYGIELWEEGMQEIEKYANAAILKDPKAANRFVDGTAAAAKMFNNASFELLSSFGYTSFEYTRGKEVSDAVSASSADVVGLVAELGNLDGLSVKEAARPDGNGMYS